MEFGNYGYKDEMTGASWQAKRTNLEDSIPLRHWHLNDPGGPTDYKRKLDHLQAFCFMKAHCSLKSFKIK